MPTFEIATHSLRCGLAFALLFLSAAVECGPPVVVSLTTASSTYFDVPPPMPAWAAVVDPATLSELIELRVSGVLTGGRGAADVHGHRVFFAAGTATGSAIEVIDTRFNVVEAVINTAPISPLGLAADPVRPRLYIAATWPQPQIAVFDTGSLSLLPPILLPSGLTTLQAAPVVTQDGTRLFAVFGNMLLEVSLPGGAITRSTPLALAPSWLAVNTSRGELYVAANIYGGTPALLVIATDSLSVVRSFPSGAELERVEVRPSDGALLVESLAEDDPNNTRLDAIDPITGTILATSTTSGRNVAVSVNGSELYRLRRSALTPGAPYAETSSRLVILDALTLEEKGSMTLDTRSPNDPSLQSVAILGTSPVSAPHVSSAVEYFYAALGHYFTTSIPAEIAALDGGMFPGWQRTGETLPVYAQRTDGPGGTTPVCRFYGLPEKGLDSHFYSASSTECAAVQQKWSDYWLLESSDVFDVYPADAITGTCPFETTPVYRVYNNRPDVNHRYTTSLAIRDSMVQAGWIPEGYGPNAVAFCVPR